MVQGKTVSCEEYGIDPAGLPKHIAVIMDGNGRWAKSKGLNRSIGHKEGSENLEVVAGAACDFGVKAMSVYAFSTENWKRPAEEIATLFKLIGIFVDRGFPERYRRRIKMKISGDISRLPETLQKKLLNWIELTKDNSEMTLNICLNYGGRDDIATAVRAIAEEVKSGALLPEDIDAETINAHLYTADLPDVDLLIRTSGEMRISNFLLWQIAYAEMIVVDAYWPDFKEKDLAECIKLFQSRERRYGGLK